MRSCLRPDRTVHAFIKATEGRPNLYRENRRVNLSRSEPFLQSGGPIFRLEDETKVAWPGMGGFSI